MQRLVHTEVKLSTQPLVVINPKQMKTEGDFFFERRQYQSNI